MDEALLIVGGIIATVAILTLLFSIVEEDALVLLLALLLGITATFLIIEGVAERQRILTMDRGCIQLHEDDTIVRDDRTWMLEGDVWICPNTP